MSIAQTINDLLATGMSEGAIQRLTGIPQPRINRWRHHGSKAADDALKLQALAKRRVKPKLKVSKL